MYKSISSALIVAILLVSCTTLSTPPIPVDALSEFRQTIEQLNVESDRALGMEHDLAYESFLARAKLTTGLDPRPFKLIFPPGNFDWQVGGDENDQAEFVAIANSRRQLNGLHTVLLDYVDVLTVLNSAGTPAQERIESATGNLTASVSSLATQVNKPVTETELGIFGMVANELARKVVERKRNSSLAEVLGDFQPGVKKISDLAAFAVATSATGIKEAYQNKAQSLSITLAGAAPGEKQALLEQLLEMNDRTIEQLDLLRELATAYNALPGSHGELMQALRSGSAVKLTSLIASINAIADIRSKLALDAAEGE